MRRIKDFDRREDETIAFWEEGERCVTPSWSYLQTLLKEAGSGIWDFVKLTLRPDREENVGAGPVGGRHPDYLALCHASWQWACQNDLPNKTGGAALVRLYKSHLTCITHGARLMVQERSVRTRLEHKPWRTVYLVKANRCRMHLTAGSSFRSHEQQGRGPGNGRTPIAYIRVLVTGNGVAGKLQICRNTARHREFCRSPPELMSSSTMAW